MAEYFSVQKKINEMENVQAAIESAGYFSNKAFVFSRNVLHRCEKITGKDMKKYIIYSISSGLLISAVPAMSSDGFVGAEIALGDDTCMN